MTLEPEDNIWPEPPENGDKKPPTTEVLLGRVLPISSSGVGSYASRKKPMGSEGVTPASIAENLKQADEKEKEKKGK